MRCFVACAAIALLAASGGAAEGIVSVEPVETQELFANPGMGWQTFGRPADKDPSFGELPSSVMYVRYYWAQIEKSDGVCDWSVLAIAIVGASGETTVRIAIEGRREDGSYSLGPIAAEED